MIPVSLVQPSYSPLCVCSHPARTLWPDTQLMFGLLEGDMTSMWRDMERRRQRANQAYHLLAQDMERRLHLNSRSGDTDRKASTSGEEGKENFQLTLDVSGFSPEELTVRRQGRRLIVSGKHEKKKETENGVSFHESREWRSEAELPQDVSPEDLLCSLSKDGQLCFQAPRLALPASEERAIPINVTPSPANGEQNPPETPTSDPEGQTGLSSS
ncbi:heat shock protein 30C-like [Leptodactylus fuscus]|uniref:heat shock protein 30C-like n=1 Tax=Leptodactylus fuscus TaxID=238119 RepID=UPI003F4ECA9E